MHLTQGGSVERPLTSRPRGWQADQTRCPAGPTFQPLTDWLHGHALYAVVTRNPKLEVGGSQTQWPPDHMARLDGQHLACYRINKVGNSSLDPYKYPPADGIQDTTLYLWFSTCKGSSLVVEA
jgi:hypothetical protein